MRLFLLIFLYAAHCNGQMGGGDQMYNSKQLKFVVKVGERCTGSIISKHYVLTAGHCVKDETRSREAGGFVAKQMSISAGDYYLTLDKAKSDAHPSETRKTFQADQVIPYPGYMATWALDSSNNLALAHDLALLYFKNPLFQDGDESIKSIETAAAGQRWNFPDPNVYIQHLRTYHRAYQQSYQVQDDNYWGVDGKQYPVWTTLLPFDHYKDGTTGAWVEYVPPAGSNCWVVGLGCSWQKITKNRDGSQTIVNECTNIKTTDEVKIETPDTCIRQQDMHNNHNRNFCFGRGLRYGGRIYGGDSGGPVICNHQGKPPGGEGWKLYGVTVAGNHNPDLPYGYATAMRLTDVELNQWIRVEMGKKRN